ncbi:alpha/beta hydrolase [Qipengyuania spongiae]|uniref:Alpha/beta fold hydrolase n=1 Tax=Qipengyuania spongiae TaxID=2909673 RepID=A0ABY5T1L1_9SPHN|nr:alpha/beta fold hydrolase [Qipengyuania spongiae]UVI40673.1 alpha/beta fold hydrolase [Qipengyuania spongiae]
MIRAILLTVATAALANGGMAMAREVTIERSELAGPLAGTFEGETNSGRPGVVIVPGSGPTDRDGNSPLGVKAQPYRLLAAALVEEGIASIRIDKRGMFGSEAAIANANEVTIGDYAEDTLAWAAKMRSETRADCAWLLGHSEGGLVVLDAAKRDPAGLCGVILVSSLGRRPGEVIKEQLAANGAAPLMDEIERHIATLERGERIEGEIHPGLAPLFGPQLQTFMASFLSRDPAVDIAVIDLPVLIVQGSEDLQVRDADAEALAVARPDATLVSIEGMNHVLKSVPHGDRAANLASYGDPGLPLADGVAEAIAGFVAEHTPAQ